jgi:hypothetical protein
MVDDYFVNIPDKRPLETAILETAKFSLLSSQAYYKLLDIRKEKTHLIKELEKQVINLSSAYAQLLELLPHHEFIALEKKLHEPKKVSKSSSKTLVKKEEPVASSNNEKNTPPIKSSVKKSASKKSSDPIISLKESLQAIEKKLSELS